MTEFLGSANEDLILFDCEVTDEALEAAGADEMANYTLAACTGLSVCPG